MSQIRRRRQSDDARSPFESVSDPPKLPHDLLIRRVSFGDPELFFKR